jgi:hypothetical protein
MTALNQLAVAQSLHFQAILLLNSFSEKNQTLQQEHKYEW